MGRRARVWIGIAIVGVALVALDASAQAVLPALVTFEAPHAARASRASLDRAFAKALDADAALAKIATPDALIAFALRATGKALHFGLGHRTKLAFDGAEREGNCVEYAELFAAIVSRERGALDTRAWVVRSDARVFGKTLADPAFKDHDWVLVVVRTADGTKRLYVDPTFDDMGVGWDISRAVHGDVHVP